MTSIWTRAAVEARLIEMHLVLARTTSHPMHLRTRASDVPQHISTEDDRIGAERARLEYLKIEEFYDDAGNVIKPIPLGWREGPPPIDRVTRANQAFWWIAAYVRTPRARLALQTYISLRSRGRQGYPNIICRRLEAKGLPVPGSTRAAYRLKDSAVDMIVVGLRSQSVPVVKVPAAA